MITLIRIELYKIFKKWRTYIGFIAIGVLTPVVQIALYFEGQNYINIALHNVKQSFIFVGNLLNGFLIGHFVLQALYVHIPFLVVLVGGDLLAGEAASGTYRMLVTRPVSRFSIVTSKYISGIIYTNLLLIFLAILSLGGSVLIFGTGELLVFRSKIYIIAANDVLWRFFLAYCFASLSLTTVLGLSFLFSSLVENAIGPIIASMAVIIIFIILSALPIEALKNIKPFLFTNYMAVWREFFTDVVDYAKIIKAAAVLLAHIAGFYAITLIIFKRKDILT